MFAYPTESFYALGVDATNPLAIRQLFHLKHREKGKPIALIAGDLEQVRKFFYLSKEESKLARKYWPGAMTILLRPKKQIAARALVGTTPSRHPAGHPSFAKEGTLWGPRRIGVRVPAHAQARALAMSIGAPITATSANISGQPPTKLAAKVKKDFPGILVMSGRCGRLRQPSTVIEMRKSKIHILRHGSVHLS